MTPAAGPGILSSIENNAVAAAMRGDIWLYPAVEIIHISGFVILVGAVVMFDLRLLGLNRGLPVRLLARHLLPWSFAALFVIVPSGLMMFSAHASDFIANRVFLLKLTLLTLTAANAAAFHTGVFRSAGSWNVDAPIPVAAKLHAIVSILLWFSIISCGRLLAYV